jgi:cytosine/uracil/thiamine/allantoin permease
MKKKSLNEWLLTLRILRIEPDNYNTSFIWFNPITYAYLTGMLIYLIIKIAVFGKDCAL